VGYQAGDAMTNADYNTAIGHSALGACVSGDYNVAVGYEALTTANEDSANQNTALGYKALTLLSTAVNTTAVGSLAGGGATLTGDNNTLVGKSAGSEITSGLENTAIGSGALDALTGGGYNTAVGRNALGAATTQADQNVAIGRAAMSGAIGTNDVNFCVVVGDAAAADALTSDASGTVAVGKDALAALTSGAENTAVGFQAGQAMTVGSNLTAVGYQAGLLLTLGANANTAIGAGALKAGDAATTDHNTCVGYLAGSTITSGSSNTLVGSGAAVADADTTGNIVLGVNTQAHADGTYMSIGTGTGTDRWWIDYGTSTTWARESDERLKKNIENSTLGLDFVNDLRAVKYQWRTGEEQPEEVQRYSKAGELESPLNTETINYGMIAQEVKSALDTVGVDDFPGWSEDRDGIQALSVSSFVLPLIKAVQELSAKVEALEDAQ
jgi:hypothetical protein